MEDQNKGVSKQEGREKGERQKKKKGTKCIKLKKNYATPVFSHLLQLRFRYEISLSNCLRDTLSYSHGHLGSSSKDFLIIRA